VGTRDGRYAGAVTARQAAHVGRLPCHTVALMDWVSLAIGAISSLIGSAIVGWVVFGLSSRDLRRQIERLEEQNEQLRRVVEVVSRGLENTGLITLYWKEGRITGLSANVNAPVAEASPLRVETGHAPD
jgi:Tfp pilus assembly protein PilW